MLNEVRRFDRAEYDGRLRRLRQAMQSHAVDAFLADDSESLSWITGYETSLTRYRACLVPSDGTPLMMLRTLDVPPFLADSWFSGHVAYPDWEDPFEAIGRAIEEAGFANARIGFDPRSHALTVEGYQRLTGALPRATFVGMPGVPWDLRLIKSPAEVDRIARAATIADQTIRDIIAKVQPGTACRAAAAIAAQRFIELGADTGHVGPITAGQGWDFLHNMLHEGSLAEGDILHLELVPRFAGYGARVMRCVAIGAASSEQREVAAALIRLQDKQIAALRPGTEAREADAILRDGMLKEGLRETFDNVSAYTLGFYPRQSIRSSDFTRVLHPHADWILEEGMVLHVYASAQGQAISETVHVAANGPERLTRIERRLFETGAS
jgi:Xaa-Pro dipeptidase